MTEAFCSALNSTFDCESPRWEWAALGGSTLVVCLIQFLVLPLMYWARGGWRFIGDVSAIGMLFVLAFALAILLFDVLGGMVWEIRFVFGAVSAVPIWWLLSHTYLLHRYSALGVRRSSERLPLLDSQRVIIEDIVKRVRRVDVTSPGPLISLAGSWGAGKSHLIESIAREIEVPNSQLDLEDSEATVSERGLVVVSDAWQRESEGDVHLAVYEDLLAHPLVLFPWGWIRYPSSLAAYRVVESFAQGLRRAKVTVGRGGPLEIQLEAEQGNWTARIPWFRSMQQTLRAQVLRGWRVVLVLEELDRATPEAAQAVLSFTRRAFEYPGVTVLLPYVPAQIQFKVFNPFIAGTGDLLSTMHAVLWQEFATEDRLREVDLVAENYTPGVPKPPLAETLRNNVTKWLLSSYAKASENQRARIFYLFSEKYLAGYRVPIPSVTAEDVVGVLVIFPAVSQLVTDRYGPILLGSPIQQMMLDALEQRRKVAGSGRLTLRHLESKMVELLAAWDRRRQGPLTDRQLVGLAVAAELIAAAALSGAKE